MIWIVCIILAFFFGVIIGSMGQKQMIIDELSKKGRSIIGRKTVYMVDTFDFNDQEKH